MSLSHSELGSIKSGDLVSTKWLDNLEVVSTAYDTVTLRSGVVLLKSHIINICPPAEWGTVPNDICDNDKYIGHWIKVGKKTNLFNSNGEMDYLLGTWQQIVSSESGFITIKNTKPVKGSSYKVWELKPENLTGYSKVHPKIPSDIDLNNCYTGHWIYISQRSECFLRNGDMDYLVGNWHKIIRCDGHIVIPGKSGNSWYLDKGCIGDYSATPPHIETPIAKNEFGVPIDIALNPAYIGDWVKVIKVSSLWTPSMEYMNDTWQQIHDIQSNRIEILKKFPLFTASGREWVLRKEDIIGYSKTNPTALDGFAPITDSEWNQLQEGDTITVCSLKYMQDTKPRSGIGHTSNNRLHTGKSLVVTNKAANHVRLHGVSDAIDRAYIQLSIKQTPIPFLSDKDLASIKKGDRIISASYDYISKYLKNSKYGERIYQNEGDMKNIYENELKVIHVIDGAVQVQGKISDWFIDKCFIKQILTDKALPIAQCIDWSKLRKGEKVQVASEEVVRSTCKKWQDMGKHDNCQSVYYMAHIWGNICEVVNIDTDTIRVKGTDGKNFWIPKEFVIGVVSAFKEAEALLAVTDHKSLTPMITYKKSPKTGLDYPTCEEEWVQLKQGNTVQVATKSQILAEVKTWGSKHSNCGYEGSPEMDKDIFGQTCVVEFAPRKEEDVIRVRAPGKKEYWWINREFIHIPGRLPIDVTAGTVAVTLPSAPADTVAGLDLAVAPSSEIKLVILEDIEKTKGNKKMNAEDIEKLGKKNLEAAGKAVKERRNKKKQEIAERELEQILSETDRLEYDKEQIDKQLKVLKDKAALFGYEV